jgi:molybdenum cofactor guanylyltransferase
VPEKRAGEVCRRKRVGGTRSLTLAFPPRAARFDSSVPSPCPLWLVVNTNPLLTHVLIDPAEPTMFLAAPKPRVLTTELEMSDLEGFILAGGASSRMGEDKSRLRLGGRTFVERVAAALGPVVSSVSLVSSRPDAEAHGLPVVRDLFESRGALGAVHAALASCRAPRALVVSCDLPFVTRELFERLLSLRPDEADAVAPVQQDGRPQPLCALYAAAECARAAEELIRTDELRPRELLRLVRTRWVAFGELADLPQSALFFENVNTPRDYEKAKAGVEG